MSADVSLCPMSEPETPISMHVTLAGSFILGEGGYDGCRWGLSLRQATISGPVPAVAGDNMPLPFLPAGDGQRISGRADI